MKAAFLIAERALRSRLAGCIDSPGVTVDEFPTAAKALVEFTDTSYDLIVLHWKVHPGLGAGDTRIDELATLIPNAKYNRNVFYWEVGLRVIDLIRSEDSANQTTPVIIIFPDLSQSGYGRGDELTRDAVDADIAIRQPIEAIYGLSMAAFRGAVARQRSDHCMKGIGHGCNG
jgi:hypothetical protein